ncbi:MAG: methionyl-tRNA formyltransferase [Ilumatobacteraceae bacterium]|jgi:methionyl-tRNA formyltransferase|nr:methionyl-tRNA formyltransferase [Ilumatobacteraceae bacterium]
MHRRIVFLGSPNAAVVVLRALHVAGHDIALVVTRPDMRRGRGSTLVPTEVKSWALDQHLEVTDDLRRVADFADGNTLGVVVAYGRIIPVELLLKMPMVNVHFSLLPRWRGAAPVERALLEGDGTTGVCIMNVAEGLDTGDVHASATTDIASSDTTATLTERLAHMGADLLLDVLRTDLGAAVAQSGDVTYAHKVDKSERVIDWSSTAEHVHRRVRALPAVTTVNGKRLRIIECAVTAYEGAPGVLDDRGQVGCAVGSVELLRVQPEGRSSMTFREWANGSHLAFPVTLG